MAKQSTSMKSSQVIEFLKAHFPKDKGFVVLEQVANSNGFVARYADAIVMNVWQSRFEIIGVEIKVSRSDWLNEIKNPAKADKIFQYCDSWYVATPSEIVRDGELPKGWGHLEIKGDRVYRKAVSARNADKVLDDGFLSAVLRRVFEQATPNTELATARQEGYQRGFDNGRESESYNSKHAKDELRRIQEELAAYERASGLRFRDGWSKGGDIGAAVKVIMNSEYKSILENLLRLRKQIAKAVDSFNMVSPIDYEI